MSALLALVAFASTVAAATGACILFTLNPNHADDQFGGGVGCGLLATGGVILLILIGGGIVLGTA